MLEKQKWLKNYDYNVPTELRFPRIPVQDLVHFAASQAPNRVAIDFYGTEFTFTEVRIQMLRLANALVRLGIKKGDRVGIALPSCPQFVIAFHAALSVGAIVVNINPLYTRDELKFIMTNSGLDTLFTFDMVLPVFGPLAKELGIKRVIVTKVNDYLKGAAVSSAKSLELGDGCYHFSELINDCTDARVPRVNFSSQDGASILYTGGTTGLPKGALITHANIIAAVLQASNWFNSYIHYTPFEKRTSLIPVPLFHSYGNLIMNWSFFNTATMILIAKFDMDDIFNILKRHEITFFAAVPTLISAMVNNPKAEEFKIAERIRYLNYGGAPMPVELVWQVRDMGIKFGESWGMSETSGCGCGNPILVNKIGSIGIPLVGNEVRLVDLDSGTQDVKLGEPGEILFRGPAVMKEYWQNPEETKNQLTADRWLHTGDIAQADEDGYLYIVDRKKDLIIASGFNVYPREVDEVLYQHPKILEAITVGIPDEYRGETIKCFVVLKPGDSATDKEIIDFCREKLAAYKVPKLVEFRPSLPKSSVGKLLRKTLRDEEIAKKGKK